MCSLSHLIVMGMSSDSERNLIGRRTESDRTADAFKGVHLSQVHQQSNIDTPLILLVQFLLAWLVHLRQVHPLKEPLARLVQFLLWQAAKPSGDKCTP